MENCITVAEREMRMIKNLTEQIVITMARTNIDGKFLVLEAEITELKQRVENIERSIKLEKCRFENESF